MNNACDRRDQNRHRENVRPGARGFGFVSCRNGEEIYFHCTTIESDKLLKAGDAVKFIVGYGRDGRRRARNVAVL